MKKWEDKDWIKESWKEWDRKDRKTLKMHWNLTEEQARKVVESLPNERTLSPVPHLIQDYLCESFLRTMVNGNIEEPKEVAKIIMKAFQKDFNRWYE